MGPRFVGKSNEIERLHLKCCQRILKVKTNSCNAAVYGELGRYLMFVPRYVRTIKYWCKLLNTETIILKQLYQQGLTDCINGHINWVSNVKSLLDMYGFSDVFISQNVNIKMFPYVFKQRAVDVFIQEWYGSLEGSPVLHEYRQFKTTFEYEHYLDILTYIHRCVFAKYRISSHCLRIHSDTYGRNAVPRNERYSNCCNTFDIEDLYHFVIVCPHFADLRKTYIKKYYYERPSDFKWLDLLQTNDKTSYLILLYI